MKVLLPKELSGTKFAKVLGIELNDFDIGRLLPGLFYLVVADGFGSSEKIRDDETVDKNLNLLAQHQDLVGFDGSDGKLLLERLIRSTLITTTRIASDRQKERVATIKPYSLVAMKTAETRGQRRTDVFIYQVLKSVLSEGGTLKSHLIRIFGRGVNVKGRPEVDGKYDEHTDLDTLTRLSIMFLDGFRSVPSTNMKRDREDMLGACPSLAKAIGVDILNYLTAYYNLMPTQAFMHYLQGLLRFELCIYTLKVAYAVNELIISPDILPEAMHEDFRPSLPQIYLDFTGKLGNESARMAKDSIKQDIEAYQQFFTSNLMLRQLDSYVNQLREPTVSLRSLVESELEGAEAGPLYLQKLLTLQNHPRIGGRLITKAEEDIDKIRKCNSSLKDGQKSEGEDEDLAWLEAIAASGETELECVVALLSEAQRGNTITKYIKWFWDIGGNDRAFGLIEGRRNYRPLWKYAPTNELLSALVQLAATRIGPSGGQDKNDKGVYTIRLQDFLSFLEERFGILIDRPPDRFIGAEYAAAARENLHAMLRRLRQMGIFRDLSDDFTAQRLYPPYAGEYLEMMEIS